MKEFTLPLSYKQYDLSYGSEVEMGFAVLHGVDLPFTSLTVCAGQCLNHTNTGPVVPVRICLQQNNITDTKIVFLDLPPHPGAAASEDIICGIVTRKYS